MKIRFFQTVMIAIVLLMASCSKQVGPTKVLVQDRVRHYSSIIRGQNLKMEWRISNVGDEPLVLTDIQPSCGCICSSGELNNIILPHSEQSYEFTFDSDKNVGYVSHVIRLYGNVDSTGVIELEFDTHVVVPHDDSPDYEDVFYRANNRRGKEDIELKEYTVDEE